MAAASPEAAAPADTTANAGNEAEANAVTGEEAALDANGEQAGEGADPAAAVAVVVAVAVAVVAPRTLPATTAWAMTRTTRTTVMTPMLLMSRAKQRQRCRGHSGRRCAGRPVRSRNSISMTKPNRPLPKPRSRSAPPPLLSPHRSRW
ncbi:hypothetical protein [Stenotrophomonas sp. NRRL B-14846]|uniref:hypothetical protein n=1 Tax=Stenotrophomonas sp. NRRL B-14846 TaxID=3162882 RepID=UPI003D2D611D